MTFEFSNECDGLLVPSQPPVPEQQSSLGDASRRIDAIRDVLQLIFSFMAGDSCQQIYSANFPLRCCGLSAIDASNC